MGDTPLLPELWLLIVKEARHPVQFIVFANVCRAWRAVAIPALLEHLRAQRLLQAGTPYSILLRSDGELARYRHKIFDRTVEIDVTVYPCVGVHDKATEVCGTKIDVGEVVLLPAAWLMCDQCKHYGPVITKKEDIRHFCSAACSSAWANRPPRKDFGFIHE
jgi:hypothetical protein